MTQDRTDTPLKLGFVGGSISSAVGRAHAVACVMDRRFELTAGCFSEVHETNRHTAIEYGVSEKRLYGTWQELLARERGNLDAMVVLLPTPLHHEVVRACLESGFPVICEKALACSSAEAADVLAVTQRLRGFLAVTYNYSGYPMVRELRHRIREGELGTILHFQVEMPQEGFIKAGESGAVPTPQTWRLHDTLIPTLHLDLGVHLHHLLHYLIGRRPLEVIADHSTYGQFTDVVDYAMGLCRYAEGIRGQIWFSKAALGHRNGLRLRVFG
ncbi:MAG TPA: Gfo/Idh/MocA family oxidoreductase, partial [Candidatus Ozemobacteraceae bacterium]|nr:Gfo/Idh/MocA family oxidoreductase [Candidatus Ozemobacteraceae bacterium]